ncbi:hypothetical protein DEU37_1499 [Microbacterium sp. AG790]|uniref:hypothetical protein n=1 Tax=Microbacterium sp. AG790 TaxID=2183995 RepID=UPI000EAF884F|nr:hypothetical protein [Microbacterium sp. AG790]RKS90179.1 hypothetical protein DEU37_1499 [Microbacterium sp. AG790]
MTRTSRPTGARRLILSAGVVAVIAAGATAAAYTDYANVSLGTGTPGSGIGNPNKFDIAVRDAGGTLQDAATRAAAVVLPLTSGTTFKEGVPVRFDVTVANRAPGVAGDLKLSLYDPDPQAADLFGSLRFTIYLDGSATAAIANATADAVNTAGLEFANVGPGVEHQVRVDAVIVQGAGIAVAGKSTAIGLQTNGESR